MMGKFIKKTVAFLASVCIAVSVLGLNAFAIEDIPMGDGESVVIEKENTVDIPAKAVKLNNNHVELHKGDKFKLTYKLKPKDSDDIVTFKSYNKKVATIDENGVIKAVGYGTAKITAKATSGRKMNCVVKVLKDSADIDNSGMENTMDLIDEAAIIKINTTFQIEPQIPAEAVPSLAYKSNNTSVATVNSTGFVKAVGIGSTTITVTAGKKLKATFYITVYDKMISGIDVSKWQGNIDWSSVRASGTGFAMIRSSFGSEDVDVKFNDNVAGCQQNSVPYGFYHYTYAKSTAEAKAEAEFFLQTIQGYSPSYPVVLDIEDKLYKGMSKKQITDIICTFTSILEDKGYYVMVYSYANFLTDKVDLNRIKGTDIWVASWGNDDKLREYYKGTFGMWQYSSTGRVNGINGDVDLNYAFKDYAHVIRKNGLNNY